MFRCLISHFNDVFSLAVVSVIWFLCLQTHFFSKIVCILPGALLDNLGHRKKDTACVFVCVRVCICLSGSKQTACAFMDVFMCDLQLCEQTANGHREQRERGFFFFWLTKDVCRMSFFCKGLQFVVTPAVLSVAVPGMFHHLKRQN